MKKELKWILGALALVAVIAAAYVLYQKFGADYAPENLSGNSSQTDSVEINKAPDFTVIDAYGNEVSLSDFVGKPVVVNFWASWCSPCKREMPDFNVAHKEYGDEVQFMMINLTDGSYETLSSAKSFLSSQNYGFPVYFDTNASASSVYYTASIPVTYFIDKDGNLIAHANGMLDAESLERGIQMILD